LSISVYWIIDDLTIESYDDDDDDVDDVDDFYNYYLHMNRFSLAAAGLAMTYSKFKKVKRR
jgi:hypothetical protein